MLADAVPVTSSTSFSLTRGRLWADDRVSLPNSFSAYTVTFDIVDPSVPLVATLVWWDAPVSIVAPIIIANDYDLTCFPPNVTTNQFAVYTGSSALMFTTVHLSFKILTHFRFQATALLPLVVTALCTKCLIASTRTSVYSSDSLRGEPTFALLP